MLVYVFLIGILILFRLIVSISNQRFVSYTYHNIIGPITPIGGLFFIVGWGMIFINFTFKFQRVSLFCTLKK
jgi:uncharacterized membrane protein YgdD (TMEM256/DUF423 family)